MGNGRSWQRLACAWLALGLGACNGQLQPADEAEDAGRLVDAGGLLDAPKADNPIADAGADAPGAGDASIEGGLYCGDGQCSALESAQSCPADCGGVCGDEQCGDTESACFCPGDCGATTCGDGCCGEGEDACSCAADCGATKCGDGCCGGLETTATCAADCGSKCADGACTAGEGSDTCPSDCGSSCGDGVCNGSETACSCASDCGATACGDGCCGGGESSGSCSADCGASCGDGACNGGETPAGCPADCAVVCGDDSCDKDETACGCAVDCGATTCGDGCCGQGEDPCSCAVDCGATTCGDGCCGAGEGTSTCANDCGAMCGDGACNGGESTVSCPADCGARCGDGACNGTESTCSCSADCGATTCGDGCCGAGEGTASCASDCGTKCGDSACNGAESTATCSVDCGSSCGDGACNGGETPCDCPSDCGGPACGDGYCCSADGENACNCGGDCSSAVCGDGCCTGSETGASCSMDCDGGPLGSLAERLGATSVSAPAGVKGGVSNWRVWGRSGLRIAPVFTVPLSNCQTLVGYTTSEGGALKPRVARLDANDKLVTTYTLTQDRELRGLAAEPDGHFGALLFRDNSDQVWVNRYDASGAQLWSEELINSGNTPTDFGIGDSRLEFGGNQYGAYYHVHSNDGHEGDTLKFVDTAAGATTRWSWGCSHMMSALLRYNVGDKKFLPVCVTDCYPGTSGDFASQSIGGIYLNHRTTKVTDVAAGCNGRVAGELGSAAPAPSGWKLVFNAHRGQVAKGQSSYDSTKMNQDVGFASVSSSLASSGPIWLTDTSDINEADASIARWQPEGDAEEQYLVGWTENNGAVYRLGVVGANGSFLEGPIDITASAQWGRRDDPMRAHKNGDVVWSWFDAAGDTSFRIARVRSGRACIP